MIIIWVCVKIGHAKVPWWITILPPYGEIWPDDATTGFLGDVIGIHNGDFQREIEPNIYIYIGNALW